MNDTLETIRAKCVVAGLEAEFGSSTYIHAPAPGQTSAEEVTERYLKVLFSAGRNTREVLFYENDNLDLGDFEFTHFKFIDGYEAIWSPTFRRIECELSSQGTPVRTPFIRLGRMMGLMPEGGFRLAEIPTIPLPSPGGGLIISLGPGSREHAVLCSRAARPRPTFKIEDVPVERHDQALDLLERLANAACFQIDLVANSPLYLAQERDIQKSSPPPLANGVFILKRFNT